MPNLNFLFTLILELKSLDENKIDKSDGSAYCGLACGGHVIDDSSGCCTDEIQDVVNVTVYRCCCRGSLRQPAVDSYCCLWIASRAAGGRMVDAVHCLY